MKRFTLLSFLLLTVLAANTQNISVKSFRALPMDMTASSLEGKRIDQNGQVAALIKVMTTETGFVFEGGTLGIVDTKQRVGEIWVWVPRGLRKITILHQQFGGLRDYMFPIEIEAERTYEMMLTTAKAVTTVEEEMRLSSDAGMDSDLTFTVSGVSFTMKLVEGGTFQMGATSEQGGDAAFNEKPVHYVTLNNFYIGETEVTQALWKAVMESEPTYNGGWENKYGKGNHYPAYRVSWNDVQEFIRKLNQMTGKNFRLPTEAEWEYAARGGKKSKGFKYTGSDNLDNVAWFENNSKGKTNHVKGKSANELGLYDMLGNVWEWCQDWYGEYSSSPQTDPTGPTSGSSRVLRGGSWYSYAEYCRVSNRLYSKPELRHNLNGFRLALTQ